MHHGDDLLPARCRADAEGKHLQARKSKTPHRKRLLFSDMASGAGDSDASLREHPLPQHTQDASMPQSLHRRGARHGMRDASPCLFRGSGHRPAGRTHRSDSAGKPREAMGRGRTASAGPVSPAASGSRLQRALLGSGEVKLPEGICQKASCQKRPAPFSLAERAPAWPASRPGRERHASQIDLALFRDTIENA